MAPVNKRAELLKRAREHREQQMLAVKALEFQLPTPEARMGWTQPALLSKADWLMHTAGVSEAVRINFKKEAMRADYVHLLNTLSDWFTLVIREDKFTPLTEDIAIYYANVVEPAETELVRHIDTGLDDAPRADSDEDVDAALDNIQVNDADFERQQEAARRAEDMIRQQLGLADDEQVIVRVIRRGQQKSAPVVP